MSEALQLLQMLEVEPTGFDRGLGKALGIRMPDDWREPYEEYLAKVQKHYGYPISNRYESGVYDAYQNGLTVEQAVRLVQLAAEQHDLEQHYD